ncbi:autotransporter domain protein [Campylobacter iguaniorum]|uniref:Autotransporter domain protein n=1 Tax=Campylobacter iguaniorum TaxID=1244531 RepID=A0A076FEV0_9BACT|nr:autotransporter outer membrane beta-barrel domain-containing protein [Campylobacter iguaniorum]AII14339.1 autotransporter domain protein [Campylobacter iguaniorum]
MPKNSAFTPPLLLATSLAVSSALADTLIYDPVGGTTNPTTFAPTTITIGSRNLSNALAPNNSTNNNTITVKSTSGAVNNVFGGYSDNTNVYENTVNISGGAVNDVFGGESDSGSVTGNIVNISGGNIHLVYGGYSDSGSVTGNTINISGGTIESVYGGDSRLGDITGNTINISGGTINGMIYGGKSFRSGNATGNTINISGGTINSFVYGGVTKSGLAINNTINISGNPIFGVGAGLFGGEAEDNLTTFEYSIKGNTLNLRTKDITVQHVGYFEFVNFYLSNNIKANDIILASNYVSRLNQVKIGIGVMDGNTLAIKTGDKVTLINALNDTIDAPLNINDKFTAYQGISNVYEFSVALEDSDKKLVATTTKAGANEKQKAINEGAISSSLSAVSSSEQVDSALNAINSLSFNGFGEASSGSMGASSIKSNTGSYVDSNMIGLIATISKRANDSFIYSAFFEAGYGKYDSFNSFDSGDIKGSGDNSYFGFGLMSKTNLVNNFYIDNSIKFGQVKSDFKSDDFGDSSNKISASFDSKRAYYGLSLGVGNIIELDNRSNLDIYTKLYYTRVGSDSVDMSTNDKFRLDTFNSFIAKLGARYNYEIKESTTLYTGAAYEYEFDAKQKGYNLSYNYEIDPTDMQGSSGSIEAGIKLKPLTNSDRLTLDLGIKGLSGKKEGVSGNVGIEWRL